MLQARLIRTLGAGFVAAALLAACGDKPIENLERTGATAIEQASALACNGDAETLRKAIEIYTELEGHPPTDEAALVTARYVREPSKLYDVVNGQVLPVAVDCGGTGAAPATAPSGSPPITAPSTDLGEIVTSTEPPLTPDQILAEFTPEEVAEVGGQECAGELASLFVAAQNYVAEQGKDPETIDDLAGYLDQPIDLWVKQDDRLMPAPNSGCADVYDPAPVQAQSCQVAAKTLAVAREAYLAMKQGGPEPTQQDLMNEGFLRDLITDVDLVGGIVTAVPGGPCDGVDLGI